MSAPGKRVPGRPFQPGNPGRPRGARHKVTVAIEALLEGEHEGLTRKAVQLALAGDTVALRLCLDRLAPPRRDAPIAFQLPADLSAGGIVEAGISVLRALSAGEVTPDEAARVMAVLQAHRQLIETADLARRIEALESRDDTL